MIKTGYISFISETGGGYDSNGNPVAATKTQTDYIGCNLEVIKKEYKTFIDGQYKQASYSVYVDSDIISSLSDTDTSTHYSEDIPDVDYVPQIGDIIIQGTRPSVILSQIKSIQLQDNNANDLGVFQIQNTEYLNLTKRIKIVV